MKKIETVAVTSKSFCAHPLLRRCIANQYPIIRFNEEAVRFTEPTLIDFLQNADAAIIGLETLSEQVLSKLPALRIVSKYGVGLDNLDLQAMRRHRVKLGYSGGVNALSVAEHTLGCMIALLHKITETHNALKRGVWEPLRGYQLTEKVIGIIGCGAIGKELVRLLRPFGCTVLVYDLQTYPEFYRLHDITPVDLPTLLSVSDMVTLHTPLTTENRHMIDTGALALLRKEAYLINTARGGLIEEAALLTALETKQIAGFAADVFPAEPVVSERLRALDTVMLTPHIAGCTDEGIFAMGMAAIRNLTTADTIVEDMRYDTQSLLLPL